MPASKHEWQRHRRRGFDDDSFYGNTPPAPAIPGLDDVFASPPVRAVIKWYNAEKGFGFVTLSDGSGDAFLHATMLQSVGRDSVPAGATLQVRSGRGQKGIEVTQILTIDESTADPAPAARGERSGVQRSPRSPVDTSTAIDVTGTVMWYNPTKALALLPAPVEARMSLSTRAPWNARACRRCKEAKRCASASRRAPRARKS